MWKIISFFNHKGGVGKTTLVHNLWFALSDRGKRVLLVDADPQMNLTAAMYGLSTSIDYSTDEDSKWMENIEKYISLSEHLKRELRNEACSKGMFRVSSQNDTNGYIDMISGDINITLMEADLYGIIKNKNEFVKDIPYKFEQAVRKFQRDYDIILIDTSPSASSIVNALLIVSSDYFIAPVSPSFFSLQAVDNLRVIVGNWIKLLWEYESDHGFTNGLSFKFKFLGLVVQLAKRYNGGWKKNMDGFAAATEDWIEDVNKSVKKFHTWAIDRDKAVSESEFKKIFWDGNPFIIEKCCDFTQKLRTIAETEWIPVIHLTQEICRKHDKKVNVTKENGPYFKALKHINIQYRRIAEGLLRL